MDKKQLNLFDLLKQSPDFTPDPFELSRMAEEELAEDLLKEVPPVKSDAVQQSFLKKLDKAGLASEASSEIPMLEDHRVRGKIRDQVENFKLPKSKKEKLLQYEKPLRTKLYHTNASEGISNVSDDVLKGLGQAGDEALDIGSAYGKTTAQKALQSFKNAGPIVKQLVQKYGPDALKYLGKAAKVAGAVGTAEMALDPVMAGTPEQAGEVEAALEPDENKKLDKYLEAVGTEKPWKIEQLQQAFDVAQNMPIPGLDQSSIGLEQFGPFPEEDVDFANAEIPQSPQFQPMQPQQPTPAVSKPINAESRLLDLLLKAEEGDTSTGFMTDLNRAMTKISSSLAGVKPDYSGADALAKDSGNLARKAKDKIKTKLELDEVKKKQDMENMLNDPNSTLSQQAREMYKSLTGNELPSNITALQLQKAGLPLGTIATMKSSQDSKRELKEMERLQKEQAKDAKIEQRQQNQLQTISKELSKDYGTYASAVTNAEQVKDMLSMIKAGKITPGSADVGLLYKFIKAYDPESVVREGEIKLAQNALSTFDKIRTSAKNIISGDMLTPEFRDSILQLAEGAQRLEQKKFARVKKSRQKLAEKFGVDSDDYNATIYPDVDLGILESKEKNAESTQQQTVGPHGYRVRQNDKTYIWNGSKYVEEK